jgi:hypothetical protein
MMEEIIYKMLYFAKIGEKIKIKSENSEKVFRNLLYVNRVKKRKRSFKMEEINQKEMLLWRSN